MEVSRQPDGLMELFVGKMDVLMENEGEREPEDAPETFQMFCWSWSYETCVLGKGFATCQDLSVKIRIECDGYRCFQHSAVCDMLPSSK